MDTNVRIAAAALNEIAARAAEPVLTAEPITKRLLVAFPSVGETELREAARTVLAAWFDPTDEAYDPDEAAARYPVPSFDIDDDDRMVPVMVFKLFDLLSPRDVAWNRERVRAARTAEPPEPVTVKGIRDALGCIREARERDREGH